MEIKWQAVWLSMCVANILLTSWHVHKEVYATAAMTAFFALFFMLCYFKEAP